MPVKVKLLSSLLPGMQPDSNTLYVDRSGALVVALTDTMSFSAATTWEDAGYKLNAQGNVVSEMQINSATGATRTRAWTYTTDADGNVTASAGAWV
ncbi:hypothetical protein [Limnohabitans sp.]|uniref:hypothetical protein n=1 Tax=Limnohabitans sp. TaxID=1907725 RepID=UPI00286F1784|nr:hypothetical protein [Limnohabitans sp.]